MKKIENYFRLIQFSHTIFAMPFALIGFYLGTIESQNSFSFYKFLLVILCMIFARSTAMAFNRYLDKNFDAKNLRTAIREIPAGIIKAKSVLFFTIANSLLFLICTFFINKLCFFLAPIALFVVLGYSFTKRFTSFCHLILGLGLSLAPIGSYLAVTGKFNLLPLLFSISVLFWVSGFDIVYALQDEAFDKENKLYSIPVLLGRKNAINVSKLFHLLSSAALVVAGIVGSFGWFFWIGFCVFVAMLIFQHSVIKRNGLKEINLAFMTANGVASIVFSIFVLADLFFHF